MKRRLASSPILAGLVLLACNEARAPTEPTVGQPSLAVTRGTTHCVGVLTPGTYDNVEVPPGASCFLTNSTILGSVKALEHARLFMFNDQVRGNVDGDKAAGVQVAASRVGGNIQIKEGTNPFEFGVAVYAGTVLDQGNIQVEKMNTGILIVTTRLEKGSIKIEENTTTSALFEVTSNSVSGNIQIFKNSGSASKLVSANIAGGAIQCFENQLPFIGGPNTAPTKQGQCF
jgi:hypothetical protein